MPDYRTHTLVAERGDVDFHKRPDPLRQNRRKWIWLAGILGLWPLVWQLAARNDQTIYWAHTVSNSHQIVQHDCQKCHREWCQTFRMNFMSPAEIRVVEANTCQTCHWEDTRDHNAHMVSSEAQGCFDCHAEHRHKSSLNEVADVYCTNCHRDLRIESQESIVASPNFVAKISSFADHPEFQIRRAWDEESETKKPGQTSHLAFRLAEPPKSSGGDSETSWEWTDKANFKFNHKQHLMEAGVGIPANHPLNRERKQRGQEPLPTKVLSCADCHEMDSKGEYFRPLNYERHCADCHELSFSKELNDVGLAGSSPVPLPHEKPEIIRGTLRDRLTSYINLHPELLVSHPAETDPKNVMPNKKSPEPKSELQQKADWVEYQLAKLEGIVQGEQTGPKFRTIQTGCKKCHETEPIENAKGMNWDVKPPNIPERWLPHSRFRHDRHDMLECYDCHYVRPPASGQAASFRDDPGSIFESKEAKDVLMPSISKCASCHGAKVGLPIPGRVKARADCTECHAYHHTLTMKPETRELWDRSDGISEVEDRLWRQREVPVSREQLLRNLPTE